MKLIKKTRPLPLRTITLRQFHQCRNKILIIRHMGGLGDIFMQCMMFEDFKSLHPELEIVFACPQQYHDVVANHPYIDEILDSNKVNAQDYLISYNTSTACTRYECRIAPFSSEHRSDIWAWHCGVKLTKHNMHLTIPDSSKEFGYKCINAARNGHTGPSVLVCPFSAIADKDLTESQTRGLIKELQDMGCFVCITHTAPTKYLSKLDVPVFTNTSILDWMGIVNTVDYVISVDTAGFHCAGGLGKPLMGIFTFADGKVYGKYFDFVLVQRHRDNGDWDCGPCYNWAKCPKSQGSPKPCLTTLTVEMFADGVHRMFKRWPNKNSYNSIKLTWDRTK